MRIFWFNTDGSQQQDPLILLYDTETTKKIMNFPPEIVQKIIHYLPRSSLASVAGVCQLWYATAMPLLYRHLYICTLPHWLLLVRTMANVNFQFGHCIGSLVLKPSPRLISAQLTSYLNHHVVVNDDLLQPGTRGYVRIESVNFELTGLEEIDHEYYREMDDTKKEYEWLTLVTSDQVVKVVQSCPALEYLNLSGCENLTDHVLLAVAASKLNNRETSKPMKGIWISLLRELTPRGITSLFTTETRMKHLDIGYNINMTDEALKHVFACWGSTLTHVRLDTIYQVSDTTIISISQHCPHLILLHLTRCWNITNPSMQLLATHCKQLRSVSLAFLSQVNQEGVKYLVQLLPQLFWLDITGCGINSLFKSLFLQNFINYRKQHGLSPIHMQDGKVNLI